MFLTSGEAHPYYVRTSAPDAFLRGRTAETWDNGAVVTGAVDVYEMLAWAKAQREGPRRVHRRYSIKNDAMRRSSTSCGSLSQGGYIP